MKENTSNCRNRKQAWQGWCRTLSFLLVFSFLLLSAHAVYGQDAKHIILMIADGRGPQHNAAKNDYAGTIPAYQSDPQWAQHWMSTFPYGGSYDGVQAWTNFNYVATGATDSAASASAMYAGKKTNIGRVGVSYDGSERFYTIGDIAKSLGKGTGVVTTVPITDATPGVFCAHNDSRTNTYAIADECLFGDPNTTGTIANDPKYGGGHGPTLPTIDVIIGDGYYANNYYVNGSIRNKLASESGQPGKHVFVKRETGVEGGAALWTAANNPSTLKLAGLFDLIYRHDPAYSTENPTLAESTQAALAVLQKNPNGFVLVVEGGAVDWASHSNNMDLMIGEMIDFDEAVDAVIDWVNTNDPTWANTLVIVTSDHECGYLTPRPGIFQDQPLGEVIDATLDFEKIITNSGGRRASWLDADSDSVIDSGELVYWAWNSGGHTNTLVPFYARGVGAELFDWYATSYDPVRGDYIDNTNVFSAAVAKIAGNIPPRASITSITPNPATQGQTITFTGSGEDLDGTITAYEWSSSINGVLSTSASTTYSTSSLSSGTHTIALRVKDNNEAWSSPVTSSLTVSSGGSEYQLTLESSYSTDVNSRGTKYYHDGSDWVGRGSSGAIRAVNRWDILSIDPSWDIVSVEVRFYGEAKTGSPGTISLTRYGTSRGEDNPETDTGTQAYSKINSTPYASLPEPSSGSWTNWINLGSAAVSDITWCRDSGLPIWSLGLKASDAIEASTTIRHVDFSEDNEANDAELKITYTSSSSPNLPPTATNDSAATTQGTTTIINVIANDTDPDGTIDPATVAITSAAAYGTAISKGDGTVMYTPMAGFTGTDTFSYTVKDNEGATSNEAMVTINIRSENEVFVAYNDFSWSTGQVNSNITMYTSGESGLLKDYATGTDTTAALSIAGGYVDATTRTQGSGASDGTDAYTIFNGIVDGLGLISYSSTDLTCTFSGLNPNLFYELVLFGNRNVSSYTNRFTTITLSDVESFTNTSTPGSDYTGPYDPTVTIVNGYNTANGYVARFTNINPGLDGGMLIKASSTDGHYYLNALMLRAVQQPANIPPTASITSITPNPATQGQTITFTGSGEDLDGTITAYEWSSSINGVLSTSASTTYSTSSLSSGTHTIALRVKDNNEAWSSPVTSSLTVSSGGSEYQLTLESSYSTDVNSRGTKYYHDGSDWVGRGSSGAIRAVNRWDILSIDPSWDIVSVEVRFYGEAKTGSPGTISLTRYGTSRGEDNPETDTGTQAYSKINSTPYASLPEPSSGSWTNWINLGSAAVSDITWCRDSGLPIWSLGLKASDAIEASTTVRHVDFSEDNEANDAELKITYTSTTPSNQLPTASITSITPNPATQGQTITFTGSGEDLDGTITAYEWSSSINGVLSTSASTTYSTSSLSSGTHTIALRVKDNNEAWSSPVTSSLTVSSGGSEYQLTLESSYSTDVNSRGTKYYHDGSDWVGRGSSGAIRAVNRWDILSIDPSWDIVSVEVRFYGEAKTGSPGTISLTRYGTSRGEDNPETDTGTQAYSKINSTPYASLPEPSSGSWTNWINLGSAAVSDITWCRDSGLPIWSLGLKASDAIEASTTVRHVDFSEDNEANDAELRITYTLAIN